MAGVVDMRQCMIEEGKRRGPAMWARANAWVMLGPGEGGREMGEARTALDLRKRLAAICAGQEKLGKRTEGLVLSSCDLEQLATWNREYASLVYLLNAIPADAPEQIAALKNELTLTKASRDAAGSELLVLQRDCVEQRQRAGKADQAWQSAESRLVHLCQLLGVDYTCEEPETCEQVVVRVLLERDEVAKVLAALREEGETHAALRELRAERDEAKRKSTRYRRGLTIARLRVAELRRKCDELARLSAAQGRS